MSDAVINQAKVVFMPSGRRGTFDKGTPLLDAARTLGVDIDSVCGGRGLCGRCQILCAEGSFPKHKINSSKDHLSAFSKTEKRYNQRKTIPLAEGRRLSCHTLIEGDLVIDVPPESQVHRQVVRKDADLRDITLDLCVHLYYVEVEEADMHNPKGDLERLYEALEKDWGLDNLGCDLHLLRTIQPILREGKWSTTVAIYTKNKKDGNKQSKIIAMWPGYKDSAYGIAVDVGSTTIAAHLCDLVTGKVVGSGSLMNPQIRFGEDLMSRVSYVMMHPEGAEEMTDVVRQGLNDLVESMTAEQGCTADDVLEMTLVGNPIMHHLLMGINPVELGGAPFALATDQAINVSAREINININRGGMVYILPCIAGHVGADTAAMILSEEPYLQDEMTLLVDVGTNAEIVLGNRHHLLACSSPTGPAFEGAQISCGQRAAPGAIERVRVDRQSLQARFKVIGSDLWSDEEGFHESIANIGVNGICGSGIIEVIAEMYLAGIISRDGVIDGNLVSQTGDIIPQDRTFSFVLYRNQDDPDRNIYVTQNDVRQIQLGKAALYAGVKLLMDKLGITQVERIRLAGAFGSHIDVKHAMILGLIPDCPLEKVASAGNAAGTGARIALYNQQSRETIETVVRSIEKIETAVESKFQEYFVDAMAIPNRVDEFPNLFFVVEKPQDKPQNDDPSVDTNSRKRRRRR